MTPLVTARRRFTAKPLMHSALLLMPVAVPGYVTPDSPRGPTVMQAAERFVCPLLILWEMVEAGRCLLEDDFQRALTTGATRIEGAMLVEAPAHGRRLLAHRNVPKRISDQRMCSVEASGSVMEMYHGMRKRGSAALETLISETIVRKPTLGPYDCL